MSITRQECVTPERAMARLAAMDERERQMDENPFFVNDTHSRNIPPREDGSEGSVIVTMSYATVSAEDFAYMRMVEDFDPDFQTLLQGRTRLDPRTSTEEESGLLSGLYLGDE